MTYRDLINNSINLALKHNKNESDVRFIFDFVLGDLKSRAFLNMNDLCNLDIINKMNMYLNIYINENKPIQYIIGKTNFYGLEFTVNENVLIPRFETEELVENIIYRYNKFFKDEKIDVCDIATGSGCIGLTLKHLVPNMNMTITDIIPDALLVAKENAKNLNVDVNILCGDMLEPLKESKFDILISNPPYIPYDGEVMDIVKYNEPSLALYGGKDGMKFYKIILEGAKNILKNKALLAFEIGFDQKEAFISLAKKYFPKSKVEVLKDMQGKDRMAFIEVNL